MRLLSHKHFWSRLGAARALGAIGPAAREALPRLEEILRDPEETLRMLSAAWRARRLILEKEP